MRKLMTAGFALFALLAASGNPSQAVSTVPVFYCSTAKLGPVGGYGGRCFENLPDCARALGRYYVQGSHWPRELRRPTAEV